MSIFLVIFSLTTVNYFSSKKFKLRILITVPIYTVPKVAWKAEALMC